MGDSRLTPDATAAKGVISRVLSSALQLWLKSQVEKLAQLNVEIHARDRQLLSGSIPQVTLQASEAIYQGLHLSRANLVGQNIRVNLKQVIRGKALELLEPIVVTGTIELSETDLNQSLEAPLFANAIKVFLLDLLESQPIVAESDTPNSDVELNLQNLKMRLQTDVLVLKADLISQTGQATEIAIRSGFQLPQPDRLQLHKPQWIPHFNAKRGLPLTELNGYEFDLGDTKLENLTITDGQLSFQGQLLVRPA